MATMATTRPTKIPTLTYKLALEMTYTETYKANRDVYREELQDFVESLYNFYDSIAYYYNGVCDDIKSSGVYPVPHNKLVINYEYDDSEYEDWDMRIVVKCTDMGVYDYTRNRMWVLQNACIDFDEIFEHTNMEVYTPKFKYRPVTKTGRKITTYARKALTS